jgi:hypothetical protein
VHFGLKQNEKSEKIGKVKKKWKTFFGTESRETSTSEEFFFFFYVGEPRLNFQWELSL